MKITADPQRNSTPYNVWDGKVRVATHVPNKELANLFASAPALLEALHLWAAWHYQKFGDTGPNGADAPLAETAAAIAKAKQG